MQKQNQEYSKEIRVHQQPDDNYTWTVEKTFFICFNQITPACLTSGHIRTSHHAPSGGTLSGGPHLYRGLPVDLQDLPLQPHGRGQEAPGVVPRLQSQGQGKSFMFKIQVFKKQNFNLRNCMACHLYKKKTDYYLYTERKSRHSDQLKLDLPPTVNQ